MSSDGWHETFVVLRWHESALVPGASDRCAPGTLPELVSEMSRAAGASSMASYSGGLVELRLPKGTS